MSRTLGQKWYRWIGEFILIVVGVITALAADGWNQERRQAEEGRAYVEQLQLETEHNLDLLREVLESERLGIASLEAVMEARMADVQLPVDSLRELYLEGHLFRFEPLHFVQGSLSTLTTLGGLNLVKDRDLQLAILDYSAFIQTLLNLYRATKKTAMDHVDEISAMYQAQTGFSDPLTLHEVLIGPLDPALIRHVEFIRSSRVNMEWSLLRLIEATESLSDLLARDPEQA